MPPRALGLAQVRGGRSSLALEGSAQDVGLHSASLLWQADADPQEC